MRYMLIGCERSGSQRRRNARYIEGYGYETKPYMKYMEDHLIIADVDDFYDNQARVTRVLPEKLKEFKSLYNVDVECHGNINKYGTVGSEEKQPLVIISKIGDSACRCIDVTGRIWNLRNSDLLKYANRYGVANAKVFTKGISNHVIISGIGWTIPTISMEEFKAMNNTSNYHMKATEKLVRYNAKIKLLGPGFSDIFDIDEVTSTLKGLLGKYKYSDYPHVIKLPPVKYIGAEALQYIHANKIIIPDTVEVIGDRAFQYCQVNEIKIPDTVLRVGAGSLHFKLDMMKSIYIGKNITNLEEAVECWDNREFESIDVSPENPKYTSIDGILYSKDVKELLLIPEHNTRAVREKDGQKAFIMPHSVERIMTSKLQIEGVEKYYLSDNLVELPKDTFKFWAGDIKRIILGKNTRVIKSNAFDCYNGVIIFAERLDEIEPIAFSSGKYTIYINNHNPKMKISRTLLNRLSLIPTLEIYIRVSNDAVKLIYSEDESSVRFAEDELDLINAEAF